MRRLLFTLLWIAVLLFVGQMIYFVFFSVRAPRYNEGRPLTVVPVSSPVRHVSALYDDGFGNVWIGTEGNGIHRFDTAKNDTKIVAVPTELNAAKIRSLAMDRQGRLWVGTSQHGLFVRCGDEWKHYEIGQRIPAIATSLTVEQVFIATEKGLVGYDPLTDSWMNIDFQTENRFVQPTSLAFDSQGNLFVGTACDGVFLLNRDDAGKRSASKHVTAKRRFGPDSAPNVSPVPLVPCGDGLPSNQINAVFVCSDETVWVATSAGLAWSRDKGANWFFVRGRDYGDKMRGLLAGTPHGWKELPRVRFGELLPEDDLALLQEDTNGILWIGTRSLGCVAIKPEAFYRTILPKSDVPESQQKFLEEMAMNSTRFHGTKTDRIIAMTPLADGKILLASQMGSLEKMEYPVVAVEIKKNRTPEKIEITTQFPKIYSVEQTSQPDSATDKSIYPNGILLQDDYRTGSNWEGKYGRAYALLSGGKETHDRIIAFDESLCRIRPFVGFVGNRTRPIERISLSPPSSPHHKHRHEDDAHNHSSESPLNAWSCNGNAVPKTCDGQHFWCEVKLAQPGRYWMSLYFVDPDVIPKKNAKVQDKPRDHLIEIFSEPPPSKTRIPKTDWQEFGKRADEWAKEQAPLAITRVTDFGDGVYKRFELTGPGSYLVKIDKNFNRKIELCAVFIDRPEGATQLMNPPAMSSDQTPDAIP